MKITKRLIAIQLLEKQEKQKDYFQELKVSVKMKKKQKESYKYEQKNE